MESRNTHPVPGVSITLVTGHHLDNIVDYLTPGDIWEPLTLDIAKSLMRASARSSTSTVTYVRTMPLGGRYPEPGEPARRVYVINWSHVATSQGTEVYSRE